jgi:hypothetical protein
VKSAFIFDLIATRREPLQILKTNDLFGDTTQTHQPVFDEELVYVLRMATFHTSEFIFIDMYT